VKKVVLWTVIAAAGLMILGTGLFAFLIWRLAR
jgi:hypothetical protein